MLKKARQFLIDPQAKPGFKALLEREATVQLIHNVLCGNDNCLRDLYLCSTLRIAEFLVQEHGTMPYYPWIYYRDSVGPDSIAYPWTAIDKMRMEEGPRDKVSHVG